MSVNRGLSDVVALSASNSIMTIDMDMIPSSQPFGGYISLIRLHLTDLAGGPDPTETTIALYEDANCTIGIVTDEVAEILLVDGDATKGNAVYALNSYVKADTSSIYAKVKVDQGTCNAQIRVDWEGER